MRKKKVITCQEMSFMYMIDCAFMGTQIFFKHAVYAKSRLE